MSNVSRTKMLHTFSRSIAAGLFTMVLLSAQSHALTYGGKAYEQDGVTPLSGKVNFTFTLYDPSRQCLLYQEKQYNVLLEEGAFTRTVGVASLTNTSRVTGVDPGLPENNLVSENGVRGFYSRNGVIRPPGSPNCAPGYTATPGDLLYLRVAITRVSNSQTITLSPDLPVDPANRIIVPSSRPRPSFRPTPTSSPSHRPSPTPAPSAAPSPIPATQFPVKASHPSTVGQSIQGAPSQSANLLEFLDSNGTLLGSVSATGQMYTGSSQTTSNQVCTKSYVDNRDPSTMNWSTTSTQYLPVNHFSCSTSNAVLKAGSNGAICSTLVAAEIPSLDASKVSTGTFSASRIPTLTGDSGSGGTQGAVPAPASGDAAANKFLKADGTWAAISANSGSSGSSTPTVATLTDAATIAVNGALGDTFTVTLGGNRTMGNPTNLTNGKTYTFRIKQDATGYRTLTWGSSYLFAGASTYPSGNPNSVSVVTFYSDGTSLYYAGSHNLASTAPSMTPNADSSLDSITVLALTGDGGSTSQNNTFLDTSDNHLIITRNGTSTQGTFSPFSAEPGKWGCSFNGSSYVSVPHSTLLDLTSGNFTIELWAFPTSFAALQTLLEKDWDPGYTNAQYTLEVTTAGVVRVRLGYGNASGTQDATGTQNLKLNAWNHIALVRSSNTISLFVNGVSDLSYTQTITMTSGSRPILIGAGASTSPRQYFSGTISNVRITKGSALYTSSFTPSTSPLTSATGTSLLTCQDNRLQDNSSNHFTVSVSGTPKIISSSPFSPTTTTYSASTHGSSGYFNGTSDYLQLDSNSNFNQYFDTNSAFTVDGWFYGSGIIMDRGGGASSSAWNTSNGHNYILYNMNSCFAWAFNGGGSCCSAITVSTCGVNPHQWNHFAIAYNGTTTRVWLNGASIGTQTTPYYQPTTRNIFNIGKNYDSVDYFSGYLSNLRFIKGADFYGVSNTSITVPTAPSSKTSQTTLQLNFENAGILDAARKNDLITVGNARVSTAQKTSGSGSIALDGSGDYLLLPPHPDLALGTGDFTIDWWQYINSYAGQYFPVVHLGALGATGTFAANLGIRFEQSGGLLRINFPGGSYIDFTGLTTVAQKWTHYALVRKASYLKFFVNGTQVGSDTANSSDIPIPTSNSIIGAGYFGSGGGTLYTPNGYIDNLTIVKGKALYTANFTPSTTPRLTAQSSTTTSCPPNYVLVPAGSGYTISDFCVAKYEAKQSGSTGISQASGTPWTLITPTDSITACQANGAKYDLISNAEWQTVAQNIELVTTNWSSGTVGLGSINRGHSDNAPANSLTASTADTDACNGTGQTCSNTVWDTQRRTHVLSNGQVIWDLAGNVYEWVKDTNSTTFGANTYMSQVTTSSHTTIGTVGNITGTAKLLFGPSGNYTALNSGEYGGFGNGDLNYSAGAVYRGSNWGQGVSAGVFTVSLDRPTSNASGGIGFRCVYHP